MILNINKPLGLTSFDVVNYIKKSTSIKKVGHAGTLDPMATGVLIVGVGRDSTKKLHFITSEGKEYIADIVLGAETDTLDREGKILKINNKNKRLTLKELLEVVKSFEGEIEQFPPLFSAIHYKGKRLYKIAASNSQEKIKIPSRIVNIKKIELISHSLEAPLFPKIKIKVTCSKGTYIRSLARDIGDALKTKAFLGSLVRTKVGNYKLEDSLSLESAPLKKLSLFAMKRNGKPMSFVSDMS